MRGEQSTTPLPLGRFPGCAEERESLLMLALWERVKIASLRDKCLKDKNAGQGGREELLLVRSGRTSLRRHLLSRALNDKKRPAVGGSGGRGLQTQGAAGVKIWKMSKSEPGKEAEVGPGGKAPPGGTV